MKRGVLAYVMIILITAIALTNFFVPIFDRDVKTDPLITYAFMGVAATLAGFKGVGQSFVRRILTAISKETSEEKE